MGKIDELIKQLCPNGIEYHPIGDIMYISDYVSAGSFAAIKKNVQYLAEENYAILLRFADFTAGFNRDKFVYINEHAYNFLSKSNIKPGDIIMSNVGSCGSLFVCPDLGKPMSLAPNSIVIRTNNNNFYYHWFSSYVAQKKIENITSKSAMPKFNKTELKKILAPLPPLAVQKEIVEILDTFTGMIANLQEELEQRQKQFEYYRNQLLVFKDGKIKNITIGKVGDIGKICMCKRIMKSQTNTVCGIPFYKIGTFGKDADAYISKDVFEEYKKLYSYPKKGDVLMSASGTIGKTVVFDGKPSYFQDSNIVWVDNDEKKVLNSYLKYYYQIAKWKTQGGTIKRLYNSLLASTEIIYPSLDKQQKIVDKLDTFESLISNIKQEIELRQKQYEYYREKLLTFG